MTETPVRKVRVPDEIWIPADEAAKANGENVSVVIRRALIQYVKENES
ncbi:ribbon-helix-helix protein, CopG family [Microbacterium sp. NPDC087592]